MRLPVLWILLLIAHGTVRASEDPPSEPPAAATRQEASADSTTESPPREEKNPSDEPWREKIAVTAEISGGTVGPPGSTSTVLDPEVGTTKPSTVTNLVVSLPGVSENGQGGLFQGFSIRGVARQRVMSLVSGMRVTSERRAGATVTFVDPLLMGEVEVMQGPSSTFYGSGALGGVIEVMPRDFAGWSFFTGYDSNAGENYQVLGTGGDDWSVGLARRDAGNGEAADGTELNSHYTQYSGVVRYGWGEGPRRYEVLYIPTYGEEIGKDNSDFPERTTEYPLERHQMLRFSIDAESGWSTQAYIHAQDLETVVTRSDRINRVDNDAFDYGLRFEDDSTSAGRATLRWGVEAVGRADVNASESVDYLDLPDPPELTVSLDGANQIETGAFASLRWEWERTQLEAGARLSRQDQENGDVSVDNSAVNGFVGATRDIGHNLELGAGISSGTRFPGLSELFFTGTTGRGDVIGNPDLDPERSLSGEASLRWTGKNLLMKGVVFHTDIDDYIERDFITEDLLTFVNLTSGTIRGVELHGMALPAERWMVTFGGHLLEGRDDDDQPLSDVPADELFVGFDHRFGRWSVDGRWTWRADKDDPGSGEQEIPSANLLAAGLTWRANPQWTVALSGSNLLDEEYFRSADDRSSLAPGRSWAVRLIWRGQ